MEMVVEAGALIALDRHRAFAELEEAFQEIERALRRAARRDRPEVAAAIVRHAPRDDDARPLLVRDLQIRIGLVVFEEDIVVRLVPLDQFVFEDQRLARRVGADHLEIGDPAHEFARLARHRAGRAEVRADAIAQRLRLADVDHLPFGILHQIDAGRGGKRRQAIGELMPLAGPPRRGGREASPPPSVMPGFLNGGQVGNFFFDSMALRPQHHYSC